MKKKSIVSMLAVLAVSVSSVTAVPAGAAPEQGSIVVEPAKPQHAHADTVSSELTISNGTATCTSDGKGKAHVKTMNCMQYLEKKNWLGNYDILVAQWFQASDTNYIHMVNTKSDIGSGTFRLRSVFTFYAVGSYEEVTAYST